MRVLAALAAVGVTTAVAVSVVGLPITSTPEGRRRRARSGRPPPPTTTTTVIVWSDGQLVKILPVSTGNGKPYCENGTCGVAVTPLGEFRAERRIAGLHRSPLGVLYNPVYFHKGFAIHGSPSIPPSPASHGCVRVPVHLSRWIYDHVADGTPIHLL